MIPSFSGASRPAQLRFPGRVKEQRLALIIPTAAPCDFSATSAGSAQNPPGFLQGEPLAPRKLSHRCVPQAKRHRKLRGEEADRDAAFAESLCRKLAVPFRLRHAPVRELARREGLSLEEAGRILRYQILREESNGGKIAVAHHRDDQSETLLFHMVRGTGIRGLAGMLPEKDGIIRPLLCVGRAEIEVYLQSVGQEYCVDSTNADTAYARNRIRCELLPWLRDNMNPRVSEHLAELAEQAAQLNAWLQEETVQWLDRYGERTPRGIRIPLKEWKELPAPLMAPVLLEALEQCGGRRDIGSVHIRQIEALMEAGVGSRASLPGGREAEREYTAVFLGSGREKAVHELPEWHMTVYPMQKDQKIEEKQYTKCFDYDKIKDTVLLRYRQTGDYLELAGTGKKTVKRYMIDRKDPGSREGQRPRLRGWQPCPVDRRLSNQ